ncbi:class I SAM-dependent methyltransferase [Pelagibacterium xiamenense]|uniref:class I SAM-dependent methyltransferase n=1 Tax=Pelagibacterium xiamenense TaxID=2901140 RepID=UPI001E338FD2|nr:methyltransferase domain-containing protein [Pelagibacterium xiamenense]MCD7061287.1 methyltransferase domain-containing protein [Pelagibacterium xiamenense]
MTPDVDGLIRFYKSPLGRLSRHLIREQVSALAGDVTGKRILGLGFATPYLRGALSGAERVLAFMPARQGASAWPREGPSHTVLCDPMELPLTDSAVDLVIAVHAVEHVVDAEELMRELWRICASGAEIVIAVPRRRGPWAQWDNNPFGFGRPYSRGQLDALLREHSFTPLEWRDCLYLPPINRAPVIKSARLFERTGRLFGSTFAGILCVRARKEQFPAIARRKRIERRAGERAFSPQTARIY